MDVSAQIEGQAQRFSAKEDATALAGAMPCPGPAKAFLDGPIQVGNISVRKMVVSDWLTLQKIGSGVMLNAAEFEKPEGLRIDHWTDQTNCELVWIFSHPPKEVRQALKEGVDAFCERCVAETVDDFSDPTLYRQLCEAVAEQIARSTRTVLQHEAKGGDEDTGQTLFLAGTGPAKPATG
jgi:hypothetical protein